MIPGSEHSSADVSATSSYLDEFHLQRPPFENNLDEDFFFAEQGVIQRLDLLKHLIQFTEQLLVVKGPEGAGKTTLLAQLQKQSGNAWRCAVINGQDIYDEPVLFARLAEAYGLDTSAREEDIRRRLRNHCQALQHKGQYVVLLIDDAHHLPEHVISALLAMSESPQATLNHLRIVLFTQDDLEKTKLQNILAGSQQSLLYCLEISGFTAEQVTAYLKYRLQRAGHTGELPFTEAQVRSIYRASGGFPAAINTLANQALLRATGSAGDKGKSGSNPAWPLPSRPWVWALGLFIVLALVALILWRSGGSSPEIASGDASIGHETPLPLPASQAAAANTAAPLHDTLGTNIEPPDAPAKARVPARKMSGREGQDIVDLPLALPVGHPPIDRDAPVPQKVVVQDSKLPPLPLRPIPTARQPPLADSVAMPLSKPAEEFLMVLEGEAPTLEIGKSAAKPARDSPPAKPAPTRTRQLLVPFQEDWLLKQNPRAFTLQLFSVRNPDALPKFVQRHRLRGTLASYEKVRAGDHWYSLIYGEFPSANQAKAGIAKLPIEVRKLQPWVRTFGAVQDEIRANRKAAR